jgi:hypothetical protein
MDSEPEKADAFLADLLADWIRSIQKPRKRINFPIDAVLIRPLRRDVDSEI